MKPAFVDSANQYRYYSGEQVCVCLLIAELREYGFSLEEIKEIINANDSEAILTAMERKIVELSAEASKIQKLNRKLQDKLKKMKKGGMFMDVINNFKIEIKEKPSLFIVGLRRRNPISQVVEMCKELWEFIGKNGLQPTGPMMTFYYEQEFNPDDTDIEVALPIREERSANVSGTRVMPAGNYATTLYTGPYSRLGAAYAALMKWIEENNYSVTGPPCEIYILAPCQTRDETKCVAEVCFPVVKK